MQKELRQNKRENGKAQIRTAARHTVTENRRDIPNAKMEAEMQRILFAEKVSRKNRKGNQSRKEQGGANACNPHRRHKQNGKKNFKKDQKPISRKAGLSIAVRINQFRNKIIERQNKNDAQKPVVKRIHQFHQRSGHSDQRKKRIPE
jgi:hypothetical protein